MTGASYLPTPLIPCGPIAGFQQVFVKDESIHPTGTFKDRLCRRALALASREDQAIATISYGNTALSLAYYSELYDHPASIYALLPTAIEDSWVLGPSTSGSFLDGGELARHLRSRINVLELDPRSGRLDDERITRIVQEHCGRPIEVLNITEGLTTPVYSEIVSEAIGQLGRVPDVCVVPFGAGILCNETIDYLAGTRCTVVPFSVSRADSLARMLYGPIWLDIDDLRSTGRALSRHVSPDKTGAIRKPYTVYEAGEAEIMRGVSRAIDAKISAEPSGAVGLGVLERLKELVPHAELNSDSLILVINTGNAIDKFPAVPDGNGRHR